TLSSCNDPCGIGDHVFRGAGLRRASLADIVARRWVWVAKTPAGSLRSSKKLSTLPQKPYLIPVRCWRRDPVAPGCSSDPVRENVLAPLSEIWCASPTKIWWHRQNRLSMRLLNGGTNILSR